MQHSHRLRTFFLFRTRRKNEINQNLTTVSETSHFNSPSNFHVLSIDLCLFNLHPASLSTLIVVAVDSTARGYLEFLASTRVLHTLKNIPFVRYLMIRTCEVRQEEHKRTSETHFENLKCNLKQNVHFLFL